MGIDNFSLYGISLVYLKQMLKEGHITELEFHNADNELKELYKIREILKNEKLD